MTERLYYKDADLLEFDATIVESGRVDSHAYVVLDRSAFYPTSGGQSHDTGFLNDKQVIDVIETEDSVVRHIMSDEIGPSGTRVHGAVDKNRRQRNRQNHTAQHILSAAFARLYGYRTMSVHLGEEYGAVELQVEAVSDEQLREVESAANQIIADNVLVEVMFVDSRQAESLPLRKESQREGELRIIRIGEFDYSACGGTHCSTSGGVGLVKIIGADKMRGRALVKYLAGHLAVADYARRFDITDALAKTFTCHYTDLSSKITKVQEESSHLRHQLIDAQKELLPIKAEHLSQNSIVCGRYKLVMERVSGVDSSAISCLAGMVADSAGGLAVLFVDDKILLAAAGGSGLHAGNLARQLSTQTGLKGGGNERAAQIGGVQEAQIAAIQDAVRTFLQNE